MTKSLFLTDNSGSAAAEMVLVLPLLLALMFGAVEAGNFFLNEHVVVKQVRDGARFASRLPLVENYSCDPASVEDDAETKIINVTRTGSVSGTATGRLPASVWDRPCGSATQGVNVTFRCMPLEDFPGIYRGLSGDIPVVKVSAGVEYPSVLGQLGFDTGGACLRAESEIPVAGL